MGRCSAASVCQFCRHLILSEKGHVEWKLMYFALQKHYPPREQYGDTLHFCRHCSILFWKVSASRLQWGSRRVRLCARCERGKNGKL